MASQWKSTGSFWCKFCSVYVRDSPLERQNHEASAKHQTAIQRNLRDLHRAQLHHERDQQRAKDEVARLNGLVGAAGAGGNDAIVGAPRISGVKDLGRSPAPPPAPASTGPMMSAAAQRKRHAEQLLALGVALPEELHKEVTGLGHWHSVAERVVEDDEPTPRSLADMLHVNLKSEEGDRHHDVKVPLGLGRAVPKRKGQVAEEAVEGRDGEAAPSGQQAWGSRVRKYPGGTEAVGEDLDELLSGVGRTKGQAEAVEKVKVEHEGEGEGDGGAVPAVVFKKRKVKR